MHCSKVVRGPVVTFLSPSLAASQRALGLLSTLGNMEEEVVGGGTTVVDGSTAGDALDEAFHSSIPGLSRSWISLASKCTTSGSIIHFCSAAREGSTTGKESKAPFSLLAITDATSSTVGTEMSRGLPLTGSSDNVIVSLQDAVLTARRILALPFTKNKQMVSTASTLLLLKNSIRGLTAMDILNQAGSSGGLPLTSIPDPIDDDAARCHGDNDSPNDDSSSPSSSSIHLKEIVVPFFDDAAYADGSTLLSRLAAAQLKRAAVGVYRWPHSPTTIRPLPSAAEDRLLPSPSLIFHCEFPHDAISNLDETTGIKAARIGYGGLGDGQIMFLHEDLAGLDVRYCPRTTISSAFSEAQDSLLASSLKELQSTNVLLASGEEAQNDERTGKGDCWVEVRANLKHPSGYWKRGRISSTKQRIAKVPDLPYE